MTYIIETKNLSKSYGDKVVLDNINIHIPKGSIYGLVGKNGAGKTTLMRSLCKLLTPSEGSINYLTSDTKMGALIESPGLIRDFSAKDNLVYFATIFGLKNVDYDKLLEEVGLVNTANKKVKNFSLGMRQRLGIAICMLGNPEILMLDEPINGLDPEGVYEIRKLLVKINKEYNTTIIIASHIISELSKLATDYAIIDEGKLITEISKDELEKACSSYNYVVCKQDQVEEVYKFISSKFSDNLAIEGNMIKIFDEVEVANMNKCLVQNNFDVLGIGNKNDNVEEFFIRALSGGVK